MRIAIIALSVYPFGIGGAETHAYQIAKHLSKKHSILLVCRSGKRFGHCTYNNLNYYLIRVPRYPLLYHLLFFKEALPVLIKYKPNIIIIDTVVSTGFLGPFFKLFFGVPYITVVHGAELDVIKKSIFYRCLLRTELMLGNYVIAVAKVIARKTIECSRIANDKICVVPVGFDEDEVEQYRKYRINRTRDRAENKKIIIFVGRIVKEKDPMTLLEATKILSRMRNDFKLIIVGDGYELPSCKRFCMENGLINYVTFLGALPHPSVLSELARADILVLPSIDEGLPVVIMEALSLGVPVITTNVGGISEVVKDGFNGIIVPPCSSKMSAKAINLILNDKELYKKLANNGIKSVEKFSWSNIAQHFDEIIKKCTEKLFLI